jgi:Squalene epoxidase
MLQSLLQHVSQQNLHGVQVRSLVDVPGEKLPSAATGALQEYLRTKVGPQVGHPSAWATLCRGANCSGGVPT